MSALDFRLKTGTDFFKEALIYYLNRQGRKGRQEFSVFSQPHFLGVLGALGGSSNKSELP